MTDTVTKRVVGRPDRAVHEMLTRRYSEAYEAWTRQEAVVEAMRADLDTEPGDEVDRGSGRAQLDEQIAVAAALRGRLDNLAVAVERSENGVYGHCVVCGDPIAADRLELFPAADHCVACKQRAERR
jgi:DnaK suppressor protein